MTNLHVKYLLLWLASVAIAPSAEFYSGQAARLLIGQKTFTEQDPTSTQGILGGVGGLAIANNMLFVADANPVGAAPLNNRVLIYRGLDQITLPVNALVPQIDRCPACRGAASTVLGQTDFVKNDLNTVPAATSSDGNFRLWWVTTIATPTAPKVATEILAASWRSSFAASSERPIAIATARAGNVIGGGDWGQDRLLPDAVRAWEKGATLHIRRPQATRPWQHVLEPLAAYLRLALRLWESPALAGAYNFGPLPHEAATVKNVIELASTAYPASATSYENESEGPHEAGWLALETAHARQVLGVAPHWSLNTAVARTMNWYRQQHGGADARALCLADIDAWEARP